jgi:hypothetical protein
LLNFENMIFGEVSQSPFKNYLKSGLYAIAFEFGGLSLIQLNAFRGLEGSLKEIYLKKNKFIQVN